LNIYYGKGFFFFFLGTYNSKQTNKKVAKNKITRGEVGLSVFPSNNLDKGRRRGG
jgi:hypothetical protein